MNKGNLYKTLSSEFRSTVRGQIKNNALYVYPNSQSDFEKMYKDPNHPYAKMPCKTLDNRSCSFIITKLKYQELHDCRGIQNQLKHIGVIEWEPLNKDSWDHRGIKCKC